MPEEPYDLDELAAQFQAYTEGESAKRMPNVVILQVYDASMHAVNGWATCLLENRTVRCMVPGPWDLTAGVLLVALPPNGDEPGAPYWAFGAFGASDTYNQSYIPPIVSPSISESTTTEAGDTTIVQVVGTDELAKVSSNDTTAGYLNGKLVAGTGISLTENSDGGNETLTITNTGGGTLADHDHSGDAGDGGTFDAANLTSGAATDGHVLTADGAGGTAWEAPSGGGGYYQTVQNNGSDQTQRAKLNLIGGTDITLAFSDDAANNRTSVTINSTASGSGGGGGYVDVEGVAGEALSERDIVYLSDSDAKWYKAASGSALGPYRGMVEESGGITQDSTGTIRLRGVLAGFTGLTAGDPVYAGSTAGGYTQTAPEPSSGGAQVAIAQVGIAASTTSVLVEPRSVRYARLDSLAAGGTLALTHHEDVLAVGRHARAHTTTPGLVESMISWWTLDEESGTRADSHGSNDLTDNNTVGYAAGKKSNAADFVPANSEYLSRASNNDLNTGNVDWTIAFWFYADSVTGTQFLVSKDAGSSNRQYRIDLNSTTLRFFTFTATNSVAGTVNWGSAISTGTWYFVEAYHDAGNDLVGLRVDGGTPVSAACTTPGTGSAYFGIGHGETSYFDGRIDEVVMWKRLLIDDERTWLYNSGSGRTYSDIPTGTVYTPLVAGAWAIGTRDVGVTYGTEGGDDNATTTTFKNVTAGTLDMLATVELD